MLTVVVWCVSGTSDERGKAPAWFVHTWGVYVLDFREMFCDKYIWYNMFDVILWVNECFENEKLFWKFMLLQVGIRALFWGSWFIKWLNKRVMSCNYNKKEIFMNECFKNEKLFWKFTLLQVGIRALVWGIRMHLRAYLNSNWGFEENFDNEVKFLKRLKRVLRQTEQSRVYDQPTPERWFPKIPLQ